MKQQRRLFELFDRRRKEVFLKKERKKERKRQFNNWIKTGALFLCAHKQPAADAAAAAAAAATAEAIKVVALFDDDKH